MPLSFPKTGNWTEMVGQTPWSARVPLDPPVANEFSPIQTKEADDGVCPTLNANCAISGKLSGIEHECVRHNEAAYGLRFCSAESVALPGYIPKPAVITLRA